MLGYTTLKDNLDLAKDIWNEKLAVEYGNTGNDYGNYTLGQNKIVLSEKLLGGGREASAKLATVMSHEGTHYNGKRVEALAHLAGAETYAFLNNKFTLQADTSFSMEMLSGIMNADNWKENTGDVDHWTLMDNGSLAYDGKANLYDENGNLIYKTNSQGIQGSLQEILGLENQTEAYNLMIQAGMEWDGKSWKNSLNPTDDSLAIKMDMTTGEDGTGRTYQEIYKTRVLTDSLTGYTATLEQHNPKNIYDMMVSYGLGPVTYDYSAITMSNGEWNGRLPVRQLSYEEWKANNYIDNPSLAMIMLGKPLEDDSNVTSEYGMRKDPFDLDDVSEYFHAGTDYSTPEGTPILALSDGVVNFVGDICDGGNAVIIQHNMTYSYKTDFITSNYYTDYFHLQNGNINGVSSNYSVGQTVFANNVLGYSGNTGTSTGPHLHAAIHFSSINDNPYANWLYQQNYLDKYKNNWYSQISNFQR